MFKQIYNAFHRHYHKRYHGIYSHAKQLFVFDLGLMAVALVTLASGLYFTFWTPSNRHFATLAINIGSERLISGERAQVNITYINNSRETLHSPVLAVHLPPGFIIDRTVTPTQIFGDNSTAELKDLPPGARGNLSISGRLFSTPNGNDRVVGILTFVPDKEGVQAQEVLTFNFTLPDSILKSELSLPTAAYPGEETPVNYTLTNSGAERVDNIALTSVNGLTWLPDSARQAFSLAPGESKTVSTTIVAPKTGSKFLISVAPIVTINGLDVPQKTLTSESSLYNPAIALRVTLLHKQPYAEVNDTVPLVVTFKNNGAYENQNQRLILNLTPGVVDLEATANLNNVVTETSSDGERLIITKKERTALANGKPGSDGRIDLTLKLLPNFDLGGAENASLTIEPAFEGAVSAVGGRTFSVTGDATSVASLPLATELTWVTGARYYTPDGQQLGRGPLPPRVGQATRYWLLFEINNTSNLVSGASFTAHLPPGVKFTGKQSVTLGPELVYDDTNRSVTWSYAQIPANSDTGLYFEVSVTPTATQTGQTLQLLQDARFEAKDDVTGKPFTLTAGAISNVLSSDDRGSKSGAGVR